VDACLPVRCLATDFYISVLLLGADRIENSLPIVEVYLPSRFLAKLWPSTLRYVAGLEVSLVKWISTM
jgi:hypothetical protein